MSLEILKKHRQVWQEKKILQRIYQTWYNRILEQRSTIGPTLEIGGGGGNFKSCCPDLICSDYTFCPWLDVNLDAHYLPFAADSLGNIVVIDVLHHLAEPLLFIEEARRVLRNGGRLIMLEPCITPGSYPVYKFLHPEDVDFSYDVFSGIAWGADEKQPFDGNMAIPTSLFFRNSEKFQGEFLEFLQVEKRYSDYLIYPLSGGFDHSSVIPVCLLPFLTMIEKVLHPLGFLFAYRMLVVLEKKC